MRTEEISRIDARLDRRVLAWRVGDEINPDYQQQSQAELIYASEMQATVWLAEKSARECVQALEHLLQHGATIEPAEMTFDPKL